MLDSTVVTVWTEGLYGCNQKRLPVFPVTVHLWLIIAHIDKRRWLPYLIIPGGKCDTLNTEYEKKQKKTGTFEVLFLKAQGSD